MTLCIEQKELLSGGQHEYACELVHYEPGFGILRYVIDRPYVIAGHRLEPGDATVAFYWQDRPYTLYTWRLRATGGRLAYFNIADRVSLSPERFAWRDLVVDIAIPDNGPPMVLDREELPGDLDAGLRSMIDSATELVLQDHAAILDEADRSLARLPVS